MGYIGSKPANNFETVRKQVSTSNSGTTITLDYPVTSVADIRLTINAVVQSYDNYSVSGSTLTVGGTLNNDRVEILFVGRTYGSIAPTDASVGLNQLSATGTASSSTFLRGDNAWASAGTTINNNADNRVITGSGTANTLEGEANLTYNGTILGVGGTGDLGTGIHVKTNDTGGTVSGDADELVLEGSAEAGLTILGTNSNRIFFGDASSPAIGWIRYFHNDNHMDFGVNDSERMRIDSSGNVIIGGTSPNLSSADRKFAVQGGDEYTAGFRGQNAGKEVVVIHNQTTGSSDRYMIEFKTGGGGGSGVGSIRSNSSSTAFNTSSDYRLKENEVAISDGIERLKQLKPYKFNFKIEPDKTVDGFFAHEVSSIVPEAISGTKDATETYTDDNGDEQTRIIPQQIDQAKLVPLLTSALQEAITKIETLEARVKTLGGSIMPFTTIDASKLGGTTLPALNGSALTNISAGKLLQTQTALFTSQSAHNSETYTASNYTDQITPSATNSKIFVTFNLRSHIYQASGSEVRSQLAIYRQINGGGFSLFYPANASVSWGIGVSSGERTFYNTPTISFMDTTHNTTNAIDYTLYARRNTSSTGSVNVGGSSIQAQVILMEIGA